MGGVRWGGKRTSGTSIRTYLWRRAGRVCVWCGGLGGVISLIYSTSLLLLTFNRKVNERNERLTEGYSGGLVRSFTDQRRHAAAWRMRNRATTQSNHDWSNTTRSITSKVFTCFMFLKALAMLCETGHAELLSAGFPVPAYGVEDPRRRLASPANLYVCCAHRCIQDFTSVALYGFGQQPVKFRENDHVF